MLLFVVYYNSWNFYSHYSGVWYILKTSGKKQKGDNINE